MAMKKILNLTFISAFIISCSSPYSEIENIDWLDGKWSSKVQGNDVSEFWERTNDSTWTGESKFMKDGEVLFSEEMSITKHNSFFCFTSSSDGQNEGKAIRFVAKEIKKDKVVFENLQHDFPQQIVYEKNHPDSLLAYIKGDLNGKKERINFRMSRVK